MTINENDMQALRRDADGLLTYEYIANHIDSLDGNDLDRLVDNMIAVDLSGAVPRKRGALSSCYRCLGLC